MLLLGVIQAQASGAAPALAGSFDLLQTEVLSSSQASVTFGSLGDYAGVYQHLQLRLTTRASGSSSVRSQLEFNGVASGYRSHALLGTGASVVSEDYGSENWARFGRVIGATSTANSFTAQVIDILDPFESTKNTTIRTLGGSTGYNQLFLHSGFWNNTAAVTSIKLSPETGFSWASFSRFSLYGWKA